MTAANHVRPAGPAAAPLASFPDPGKYYWDSSTEEVVHVIGTGRNVETHQMQVIWMRHDGGLEIATLARFWRSYRRFLTPEETDANSRGIPNLRMDGTSFDDDQGERPAPALKEIPY